MGRSTTSVSVVTFFVNGKPFSGRERFTLNLHLWDFCQVYKLGLKRLHREYSVTRFLKVPELPDTFSKYSDSIIDYMYFRFATSLIPTEPVGVTGRQRVMAHSPCSNRFPCTHQPMALLITKRFTPTMWGLVSGRKSKENRTEFTSFIQHYFDTYTIS